MGAWQANNSLLRYLHKVRARERERSRLGGGGAVPVVLCGMRRRETFLKAPQVDDLDAQGPEAKNIDGKQEGACTQAPVVESR